MKTVNFFFAIILTFCIADAQDQHQYLTKRPYAVILGIAQDGGYPHAGCERLCCKDAWKSDSLRKMVSSIAIIDPRSGLAWMFDATPDFAKQYNIITKQHGARLAGIFLTHAHIGHYTGLMHIGREVMGAKNIVVYALSLIHI